MDVRKLIEFAPDDPRIEKILGNRIAGSTKYDDIEPLSKLTDDEFNNMPYLKAKYNECIALNSDTIAKTHTGWRADRTDFVWWNKLSSGNKAQEITRWIDSKRSVVSADTINFKWLEENHDWLMDKVISKTFDCGSGIITRMIPQLSQEYLLKYVDRIFECDPHVFIHSLSNEYTPRPYIFKSLRALAGKKRVPSVKVTLDKSLLKELPPVMRLKVLESLLIYMRGGNVSFADIKTEEELGELLFGTAIKYNARVQTVVKRFKYLCT